MRPFYPRMKSSDYFAKIPAIKMKNRQFAGDTWITPKDFYKELSDRFRFTPDFDPCPWDYDGTGFDGLLCEWPERVYCNPPYSRKLKEEFICRAASEGANGKLVVMLLPVSTSTKIFHEVIQPLAEIEFIRGRLPFEGYVQKKIKNPHNRLPAEIVETWHINPGKGMYQLPVVEGMPSAFNSGQHDSMLAIFGDE
jgi:DNA N-6-adenine-methyltransferase (Dam)